MPLVIISTWYIIHVTEWINPTWHHVCIPLNKYVECNNVTVTTVFKWMYYCWFTHHLPVSESYCITAPYHMYHLTIRPAYYTVKIQYWHTQCYCLHARNEFLKHKWGMEVGGIKYSSACTLSHIVHPVLHCSLSLLSPQFPSNPTYREEWVSISSPSPLGWDLVCASCLPG
jgi:hypothetical protein